ncbi:endonuclease/exonuclease/phosphatase family protein [Marmoricola sp. URHB0036]|uniref:endonuclease/exonuclease/phosphatase family protein n=1 Tax=Marmoricola sp. URHB0036 TaxID=1298863 RepID=UPI00041226A7|nr:endonuclease/exonuclease/phosphatase family protein [Marmoricola sp. URHB0036]
MRRTSVVRLVLASSLVALGVLAGCDDSDGPKAAAKPSSSPAAQASPISLSLLVFNVEYGGTKASDAVIADLKADVVGVLESYNRLPKIAAAAGYPYYDVGLQIMSKYPILEPSGADGLYSYIEVRPGEAVAMINTHLDYVHDGPNRLNRGASVADVVATEKAVRLSSIQTLLPSATTLLDQGWPVFLTGDLNEPSHLDWTAATASQHGGVGAVAWPVSEALLGAGLHDSYRETHPDPVTDPGNTWGGVAGSEGSPRRIDFAYVGGPVDVVSSQVVGERGGDSVDRGYPKWTSDHRAVLSRLKVTPAPIPTTIALSSRMTTVGEQVTAYFRMPQGVDSGTVRLSGPASASYDVSGESGTITVPTSQLTPGQYQVDLVHGDDVVATNQLYVRPQAAKVELTTDAPTYGVGDPITVRWADGPANRWDWIGVYPARAADPEKDSYLIWGYTGGHDAGALPPTTEGDLVLGREHQGKPWPLPPGRYVAHYLLTDQYVSVGSTTFTVR